MTDSNAVDYFSRIASASLGAFLVNVLTHPFDVVKTRMQAVLAPPVVLPPDAASCLYYPVCSGADATFLRSACRHTLPRAADGVRGVGFLASSSASPPSSFATLMNVVRNEGPASLWSGLTPGLLMAVPSVVIYYVAYEELRRRIELSGRGTHLETAAPFLAGMTARSMAVATVAPLELLRTRAMYFGSGGAAAGVGKGVKLGIFAAASAEISQGGLLSLWRGLSPTLWRDLPFSGIYWMTYEAVKAQLTRGGGRGWGGGEGTSSHGMGGSLSSSPSSSSLLSSGSASSSSGGNGGVLTSPMNSSGSSSSNSSSNTVFRVSFLSGFVAGILAAVVTTPFDVIKTRRQVFPQTIDTLSTSTPDSAASSPALSAQRLSQTTAAAPPPPSSSLPPSHASAPTIKLLRIILKEEGLRGLFSGLGARVAKVAPACAIMISTYETGKVFFGAAARGETLLK